MVGSLIFFAISGANQKIKNKVQIISIGWDSGVIICGEFIVLFNRDIDSWFIFYGG